MEDIENREQPIEEPAIALNQAEENSAASENGSLNNLAEGENAETCQNNIAEQCENTQQGKTFGKFKSADSLLEAYNNLQAEFTKKCQRLSELEKDKTEKEIQNTEAMQNVEENLAQFLSKNAEAKDYADELKAKVLALGDITENSFNNAWSAVVLDHIKSKTDDKIVDKYVLSDENIKNKIIQDYLISLKTNSSPIVISSNKGQRVSEYNSDAPSSLNDAKKMMERMFN